MHSVFSVAHDAARMFGHQFDCPTAPRPIFRRRNEFEGSPVLINDLIMFRFIGMNPLNPGSVNTSSIWNIGRVQCNIEHYFRLICLKNI
jgi:hypothetical protein